ncbi:MAG: DNA alkylation repair protein [Tepidiformaceae bacterium]
MGDYGAVVLSRVTAEFERRRDPVRAVAMARYMRGQFPFLGIGAPLQQQLARDALRGLPASGEGELGAAARMLWALPEREYQYAALGLLERHVRACGPDFIETVRELITTKSWWDTVDALASRVVGPLVLAHPALAATMDAWIVADNLWLRRASLLHQLKYKGRTDVRRLFAHSLGRPAETEFFIRKAIGWALREYSKTDGGAVRRFVEEHEGELSPLSRREALAWLAGREGSRRDPRGSAPKLPQGDYFEVQHGAVVGEQGEPFDDSLGGQHPIEGVPVAGGEGARQQRVL